MNSQIPAPVLWCMVSATVVSLGVWLYERRNRPMRRQANMDACRKRAKEEMAKVGLKSLLAQAATKPQLPFSVSEICLTETEESAVILRAVQMFDELEKRYRKQQKDHDGHLEKLQKIFLVLLLCTIVSGGWILLQ